MLESAAWNSAGLPVEVCYKKTVAFVPIADSKATERKPAKGFQANTHRTIPESRKPCPAVALQRRGRLGSGARGRRSPISRPAGEKENQADPENQSHHHPGSPIRHKQEERSRPDYGQRWRPAEPDAGPLIKAGFYRADQTMVGL
jgi:hypothetical protein